MLVLVRGRQRKSAQRLLELDDEFLPVSCLRQHLLPQGSRRGIPGMDRTRITVATSCSSHRLSASRYWIGRGTNCAPQASRKRCSYQPTGCVKCLSIQALQLSIRVGCEPCPVLVRTGLMLRRVSNGVECYNRWTDTPSIHKCLVA
jgi:hypothetical protein